MNIIIAAFIIWLIISVMVADGFLESMDNIEKIYKRLIFIFICGPVCWFLAFLVGVCVAGEMFTKWIHK